MPDPRTLIDTEKYPIFDDNQPGRQVFFDRCKATYQETGILTLPGFILPAVVEQLAKDAQEVEHLSFKQEKQHNVYLAEHDPAYDDIHPRNRTLTTTNSTIADVDIQPEAALRAIYQCLELHAFIAYVTGKQGIYPYIDKLSPLNIGVSRPGETLTWHFDTSDFATTLLLQAPEAGGEFEYIPRTRTVENPGYDRVEKLLDGDMSEVETLHAEPGTLALFQGRHAIHRVAPVKGNRTRMVAILTYDEKPDQRMNPYTQQKFYGRAA